MRLDKNLIEAAEPLRLNLYLDTLDVIKEQKEVMIFQSGQVFDLKPFPRGESLKHGYKPGFV